MFEQKNGAAVMKKEHSEKLYQASVKVTGGDIEAIVAKALDGGISAWAKMDASKQSEWEGKPDWVSESQYASQVLLEGGVLRLESTADEICRYEVTIKKLLQGIGSQVCAELNERGHAERSIDGMLEKIGKSTAGEIFSRAALLS